MEKQTKITTIIVEDITVARVYTSDKQKEGTITAELKQVVETTTQYPGRNVVTSLQGNIFDANAFKFKEGPSYSNTETRVAWIPVPLESTEENVKAQLALHPESCIYKVLSNHPIITDEQKHSIEDLESDLTKDAIAEKQVVRYPKEHRKAGGIVLRQGKIQYRATFFFNTKKEDLDLRNNSPLDFFASDNLHKELLGENVTIKGQEI